MKVKVPLLIVIVIIAVSLISIGWISREKSATATKWEYKVVYFNPNAEPHVSLDDWINGLGADGWELVQVTGARNEPGATQGLHYFKRAK